MRLPEGETSALARSLPSWPVFDDVPAALAEARSRGWKLAILSNTDRDLIDASMVAMGIAFQRVVVASEIGSYKPAKRHWEVFREQTGADEHEPRPRRPEPVSTTSRRRASSDIPSIWINRLGEPKDARPTEDLTSLARSCRHARGASPVSALRARCPDCRTFTAVAIGPGYECHACGREFAAGLVRVPRAWGADGEAMADGANLPLPYPETGDRGEGLARRADRVSWRQCFPSARSSSGAAVARTWARCAVSPAGSIVSRRLGRRSRRPEHARDVSLREPLGHAAADASGRRCRGAGGRRSRRGSQPGSARAGVPRRDRDRRLPRPCAGRRRLPCTSHSISTCSIRLTSRSSFPEPGGRRSRQIEAVLRDAVSRAPLRRNRRHRASARRARTSRSSHVS